MRIIIDTDIQAIIVPDSYYTQVNKLNEVIEETGGNKLDYTAYVRTCFEKAYATQIIRPDDVPKVKGTRKAKKAKAVAKSDEKPAEAKPEGKPEEKPTQTAEVEKK